MILGSERGQYWDETCKSNKKGVWKGQEQQNEAERGRVKDRRGQKLNEWGEVDWRSNSSEVQTAPRGAMVLRRRDQARRTSQDSIPTEHLACQALLHHSSSLTSLKTCTNTPPGPAEGYNTPLSSPPLSIFAVFCPSLFHERQKRQSAINKSGERAMEC